MKFILLFFISLTADNNKISEVIVTPKAMFFKHQNSELWTIQTLNRNFQVYDLFVVKGSADSIVEKDNIPFKYYTDTITEVKFSSWTSNIFEDTLNVREIDNYNSERTLGLKAKVSMIAYMNRKTYPIIESFFSRTFRIGSRTISTSLDKPIDIIDYENGKYLYYHNRDNIVCITESGQTTFSKNDYSWNFKQNKIYLYPKKEYLPRKTITAIKNGRSWYNSNWEKLRSAGKLYATFNQNGLNWNKIGLSENEKNLLAWFIKN